MFLLKASEKLEKWARNNLPEPLTFALLLTVVLFFMAVFMTELGPFDVGNAWTKGFFSFNDFAFQVIVGMIAGSVIFNSAVMMKVMKRFCSIPKTNKQAAAFLYVTVFILDWINWGIGFMSVPFLTKELCRQFNREGKPYHLPYWAAAAQGGTLSFAGGLPCNIFIMIGQAGTFTESQIGLVPLTKLVFMPLNIIVMLTWLIAGAVIFYLLHPINEAEFRRGDFEEVDVNANVVKLDKDAPFAEKADNFGLWNYFFVLFWFIWFFNLMRTKGPAAIDMNVANITLVVFGMLLWKSPAKYFQSFKASTSAAAGVILQFPIYAGIMGIVRFTGLVDIISGAIAKIASAFTYPIATFFATGLINFAVPSGGGHWASQGPILMKTAELIGADYGMTILSFCYADSLFNLFIPFWLLPACGILGLKPREILGYTISMSTILIIITLIEIVLAMNGILPIGSLA